MLRNFSDVVPYARENIRKEGGFGVPMKGRARRCSWLFCMEEDCANWKEQRRLEIDRHFSRANFLYAARTDSCMIIRDHMRSELYGCQDDVHDHA